MKFLYWLLKESGLEWCLLYNKKLQKRLNININDYKDYSQLYSPIEIELKIVDNYIARPFIFISDSDKYLLSYLFW